MFAAHAVRDLVIAALATILLCLALNGAERRGASPATLALTEVRP